MADQFRYWGIWVGGVWSEEIEGTNGIGTCITEQKPIIVHRDQHFRTRHIGLSCLAAPIFDATGKLRSSTGHFVHDFSAFGSIPCDGPGGDHSFGTSNRGATISRLLFPGMELAAIPADESGPALLLAVDNDRRRGWS